MDHAPHPAAVDAAKAGMERERRSGRHCRVPDGHGAVFIVRVEGWVPSRVPGAPRRLPEPQRQRRLVPGEPAGEIRSPTESGKMFRHWSSGVGNCFLWGSGVGT